MSAELSLLTVTDVLENVNALSTTDGISIAASDLKVTDNNPI